MLGKLLRIDVEIYGTYPLSGTVATFIPMAMTANDPAHAASLYKIPPSNPFVGVSGYRAEIWALGLRNPWRYAFDRLTHDLYIGDVGQNMVEEIDFQPASSPGRRKLRLEYSRRHALLPTFYRVYAPRQLFAARY